MAVVSELLLVEDLERMQRILRVQESIWMRHGVTETTHRIRKFRRILMNLVNLQTRIWVAATIGYNAEFFKSSVHLVSCPGNESAKNVLITQQNHNEYKCLFLLVLDNVLNIIREANWDHQFRNFDSFLGAKKLFDELNKVKSEVETDGYEDRFNDVEFEELLPTSVF